MTPHELHLNRLAQGLASFESGRQWFEALLPTEQQQALQTLAMITGQAHPLPSELESAISLAELKPTFTPCILARQESAPERAFARILALPNSEWSKSFRLLLALFSIADSRRRSTQCVNGCSHEWHHL
jgi:hypothetical protein